jgi:hypothetical protein
MDTDPRPQSPAKPAYRTERIIASLVMAWVIVLTSYMLFQDRALSQESMYFLKILLALSGAVMLATLPGFFDISYGVSGLTIRAAGGAAAFVFIYTQSPNIPNFSKPSAAPFSTTPAITRPDRSSDSRHHDSDALPLLVSLSFDPSGLASAFSNATAARGESVGVMVSADGTAGGGAILAGGGGSDTVIGQASTAVSTVLAVVRSAGAGIGQGALRVLDRLAEALRAAISWTSTKVGGLIGQLQTFGATPVSDIQAFIASIPETTADLLNSATAPAVAALDSLGDSLGGLPLVAGLGDTVLDLPQIVNSTVGDTVATVGDLLTGVLASPQDTLAHAGKAVNGLTEGLTDTTHDVLATTRGLTQSVNAQVSAITDKLNDVAPGLVAPVRPVLAGLDATTGRVFDAAGDVTSALPPLTAAVEDVTSGLKLPLALPLLPGGAANRGVEEVRGGCANCVLPPLDAGPRNGLLGQGRGGIGSRLSGIGTGRGGTFGAGIGGTGIGGGSGVSGPGGGGATGGGPAGGGPIASTVRGLGGAIGNTTRGLLGRR